MKSDMWMKRLVPIVVATIFAAACGSNSETIAVPSPTSPSPTVPASPTLTGVTVSGATDISSSAQMTASAQFSDNTARDVTSLASWESSNSAFATISSTGMVTVVGTGEVDFRATYQTVVGMMQVAVTKPPAVLPFVLTGVVRDSATLLPLAGVRVQAIGDSAGRTTTGSGGAYMLDGLPAGRMFVEFTRDGYQVLEISITMAGDQRYDVSLDPIVP